ncbi:putative pentatricopeptide repeat-containing protein At5g08310, mitochondrial [Coffea eugenioides]|uniref:Pentatricopeptide repeat-containing protein At5g08310, mitochondrial n=1 Tax=Coffea arabica TaxID=13443 RepID=A0A6P6TIG6_COFAR|nr:putative pentatricopeptide repeat-containing protein At5g08310, mitochondrial [Coffea arabica]XP_027177706.1 putative pentatricopeptide repeat-containing protein At5g08310, mitochondrial [Coffea eugenioides]
MALFSRTNNLLNGLCKKFSILFQLSNPICTKANPDQLQLANSLISIFTRRPFIPEGQELNVLGSKLTTEIVETVLKGLKSWKIADRFFKWASSQCGFRHNCYTYNAMASILSHARQSASLRDLTTELVSSRCYMTPGAFGYFLRCLGSQGLVQEANALFDEVKRLNLCVLNGYSYSCLLEVIAKSGNVDLIDFRINEMRGLGWQLDKYSLTPALQCYCNAGKFQQALDVFNEMHQKGWLDAHVFSILAVSFSKLGEVDKAFELIERMDNLKINLNEKTFYVLIHGFVGEGRADKAIQLLDRVQKLGISPDISIYDVLIRGLCKNKEIKKALQLYSEINELGIHPDVKTVAELISCVLEERDIMRLLEERPQDLDAESILLLYNSVLKGLVNIGLVNKAHCLLRSMMHDGSGIDLDVDKLFGGQTIRPNTTSFEIIVDALCSSGKLDDALGLFRDMDRINCSRSVILYNNMIDFLSNADRLTECYELLIEMKEFGFQPTHFTYNSIFGCLCRQMNVTRALHLVRDMRACGHEPWIKNYTLLIKKLCKHGRAVEACNFLDEMVIEGFLPDMVAYSTAIDGLLKIKEIDRALKLFRDICLRGYGPDVVAYNILIHGLCKAQKLPEAQDLLNEMLEKGLVPSVVTYNLLIDGWCKNGDIDQAMLCLLRMAEKEREPNVFTYTTLIDGLCNAERPSDALKLWMEMEETGCAPNRITFMALINGLCKCNRTSDALVYLLKMEEKDMIPDAFIYVALIDAHLSNSDPGTAFDLFTKMIQNRIFPDSTDKNNVILKQAISSLSEDPRTSSSVKHLMALGSIPAHLCF